MAVNKQLQMAHAYVSGAWLPVDSSILSDIREGLSTGRYEDNRDLLFNDLKKDISLLMFCIRKLSEVVRSRIDPLTQWVDPVDLFHQVPLDELGRVLSAPPAFISRHRMEECDELQAECMTYSVLAATLAESLSESVGVDKKLAYATSLFRNLGLALISWNYPHVYRRVCESLKPHENLDDNLSTLLGFSPSLLGVTMAQAWAISPTIRHAMGDESASIELDRTSATVGENLTKLCQVGEALVSASKTTKDSQSTYDLTKISEELALRLGKDGVALLHSSIKENLSSYLRAAPKIFKLPELRRKSHVSQVLSARDVFEKNKFTRHLSPSLRDEFEKLYGMVKTNTIQKDAVDLLIRHLILPSGFDRGCIYLVEPDSLTLVPRLYVGDASQGSFKTVSYSSLSNHGNPIIAAFRSAIPIHEEQEPEENAPPSFIAGAIGGQKRAGVLYLEYAKRLLQDPKANPIILFKALRQALNDCLNLA